MSEKEKTEELKRQKLALKSAVLAAYRQIQAAQSVLEDVTKEATSAISALVKEHGPGPHKFREPNGSIFTLDFRKSGAVFNIKRTDHNLDDDDIPVEPSKSTE